MEASNPEWLKRAIEEEPEGRVCGWCGNENDNADDIGFFYCTPRDDETKPTCRACYNGEVGNKHVERYGLGER